MRYVYCCAFFWCLFYGILFNCFSLPDFFGYWDEAATLILFFLCFFKLFRNNGGKIKVDSYAKFLNMWILLSIVGFAGNFAWNYANGFQSIVRDLVNCLKFPICFFSLNYLGLDHKFKDVITKKGNGLLKLMVIAMFVGGLISLFFDIGLSQTSEIRHGIYSYQFLFGHPTSLAVICVLILCWFDSFEEKRNFLYIVLCIAILVLTMRTKVLAFVALFIFAKWSPKWMKRFKVIYIALCASVIGFSMYDKLQLVLSWSSSGRLTLWLGAVELFKKCFPIGSGFATYASHLSGKYHSLVYSFIYSNEFWDSTGKLANVLGDTGYPYYIGQFGFIGIVLIFLSIRYMIKILKSNSLTCKTAFLLIGYVAIALTGESILINNGVEIALVLSMISANSYCEPVLD